MLELGVRWRIGDGKSVRLWKDAWVGSNGSGKIISPVRILDENATVDAILDNVDHCWKVDLLTDILFPIDVDRILQIPVSTSGGTDERIWTASEDAVFRVRDAYNLALKADDRASSSNGSDPI